MIISIWRSRAHKSVCNFISALTFTSAHSQTSTQSHTFASHSFTHLHTHRITSRATFGAVRLQKVADQEAPPIQSAPHPRNARQRPVIPTLPGKPPLPFPPPPQLLPQDGLQPPETSSPRDVHLLLVEALDAALRNSSSTEAATLHHLPISRLPPTK